MHITHTSKKKHGEEARMNISSRVCGNSIQKGETAHNHCLIVQLSNVLLTGFYCIYSHAAIAIIDHKTFSSPQKNFKLSLSYLLVMAYTQNILTYSMSSCLPALDIPLAIWCVWGCDLLISHNMYVVGYNQCIIPLYGQVKILLFGYALFWVPLENTKTYGF